DERHRQAHHVADRRVAAAGVEAIQTIGRQTKASDPFVALLDLHVGGRHLVDLDAAVVIEQLLFAEVVYEGPAIVAVARDAEAAAGRNMGGGAFDTAAAAA